MTFQLSSKYCLQYDSSVCFQIPINIWIICTLSLSLTWTPCHITSPHQFSCKSLCARLVLGNVAGRQALRVLCFSLAKCLFTHLSLHQSYQLILSLNNKHSLISLQTHIDDVTLNYARSFLLNSLKNRPIKITTFLRHAESFLAIRKRNYMQVAKEYCWAIT